MPAYPLSGELSRRRLGTESGALRREARAISRAGGNPQKFLEAASQAKLQQGSAISSAEENKRVQEYGVRAQEEQAARQAKLAGEIEGGGTNVQGSGTNAPVSGTNAPAEKKSFAQQDAEARQRSALSGAFGSGAQQQAKKLGERQDLFRRMQDATPEERGGSLRDEAMKMGISDAGYFQAQQKISGPVAMTGPPAPVTPPVNQAKSDIEQYGLDEAIKRYYQRSADAEKVRAEKVTLNEMESAGRAASGITGNGIPAPSAPTKTPEAVDFGPVLAESAATKERAAARRAELASYVPQATTPPSPVDTRSGAERLGAKIGSDIAMVPKAVGSVLRSAPGVLSGALEGLSSKSERQAASTPSDSRMNRRLRDLAKGFRSSFGQ